MPSPFLLARDLVKTYGERLVLAGVSLDAYPGQRLGLVGENGAGKSTLLEILAGAEEPDSGEVVRPADVGFLRQESPFPENGSVRDVVEAALAEAREVERRLAHLARRLERRPRDSEALALYGEALEEAEVREVWDADRRAELVLDEPTNHISLALAEELEEALGSAPGAVVVATHDRWLRRRWAGSELRLVAGRRAVRDGCSPPRSGCAPRSDPPSFRPRRSTGRPCASGR